MIRPFSVSRMIRIEIPPVQTKMYENRQFAQLFVQSIIYIVKRLHKISPKLSKNSSKRGDTGWIFRNAEKNREIFADSPWFQENFFGFYVYQRDFIRFQWKTAINTENCRWFQEIHRRFHRFRPCFPYLGSGRENSWKKQGRDNPPRKIPKPSPWWSGPRGAAAAFRDSNRTEQAAHRIPQRKIFEPFPLIYVPGV